MVRIFLENLWYDIKLLIYPPISDDKLVRDCINKELKPYGVDYQYVIDNPRIGDISWYHYYTFNSEKEYLKWKKYCLRKIKRAHPYLQDVYIQRKFGWFDLMWGLRHTY